MGIGDLAVADHRREEARRIIDRRDVVLPEPMCAFRAKCGQEGSGLRWGAGVREHTGVRGHAHESDSVMGQVAQPSSRIPTNHVTACR